MTHEEAVQDLKDRVKGFMEDATKYALEEIDKLDRSGCGIIEDHINAPGPFLIPRDFIAAFADEMKLQYGLVRKEERARSKRIKNYYMFM